MGSTLRQKQTSRSILAAMTKARKAYNRAALYSGKALDFDGVNDYDNGII